MADTTTTPTPSGEGRQHVHDVLKEFDTLMLGTFENDGAMSPPGIRARPMAVARLGEDCSLSFITHASTSKVEEASMDPAFGHVFGQSRTRYVSMRGYLTVDDDRARVKALWKPAYEVWFDGPDDPDAVVITFVPEQAEVWDSAGTKGLTFLLESARALLTGKKPDHDDRRQHERVKL